MFHLLQIIQISDSTKLIQVNSCNIYKHDLIDHIILSISQYSGFKKNNNVRQRYNNNKDFIIK